MLSNKFEGSCEYCGALVPAQAGFYRFNQATQKGRVRHKPGACVPDVRATPRPRPGGVSPNPSQRVLYRGSYGVYTGSSFGDYGDYGGPGEYDHLADYGVDAFNPNEGDK